MNESQSNVCEMGVFCEQFSFFQLSIVAVFKVGDYNDGHEGVQCLQFMQFVISNNFLCDFERGQIVGARRAGDCVTKTSKPFKVLRNSLQRNGNLGKERKISTSKSNSGLKCKLDNWDGRVLSTIQTKIPRTTGTKVVTESNTHLTQSNSIKTTCRKLHNIEFHGRAATCKPLMMKMNALSCKRWYMEHKDWNLEQWRKCNMVR